MHDPPPLPFPPPFAVNLANGVFLPASVQEIPESVDIRTFYHRQHDVMFLRQVYDLSTLVESRELHQLFSKAAGSRDLELDPLYRDNANRKSDGTFVAACGGPQCKRRYRLEYAWTDGGSGSSSNGGGRTSDVNVRQKEQMAAIALQWGLMNDIRAGLLRTEYLGVVCFKHPWKDGVGVVQEYAEVCIAPKRDTP